MLSKTNTGIVSVWYNNIFIFVRDLIESPGDSAVEGSEETAGCLL